MPLLRLDQSGQGADGAATSAQGIGRPARLHDVGDSWQTKFELPGAQRPPLGIGRGHRNPGWPRPAVLKIGGEVEGDVHPRPASHACCLTDDRIAETAAAKLDDDGVEVSNRQLPDVDRTLCLETTHFAPPSARVYLVEDEPSNVDAVEMLVREGARREREASAG